MPAGVASTSLRRATAATAVLAYAVASHALMTRAQDSAWSLAIILGPFVVLGIAAAWGRGRRGWAVAGALAALWLALDAWTGRGIPARWLYLAQHAGVHFALAAWFGATLRPGAEPLISALARRVHATFTPALARYTRQLTLAWTLYFLAMAIVSVALFLSGHAVAWSLLANVLTPACTAAFFLGEYALRYILHPEFERVSVGDAVRAWRTRGAVDGGAKA